MSPGVLPHHRSPLTRGPARTATALVAAAALTVGLAGSPADARGSSEPRPGSTGSGDSLFPQAGNGGYDARHYDVALDYRPALNAIDAKARIVARAAHPLSSFSLDLQGLRVRRVVVDGRKAAFHRDGHELVITPARAVRGRFTTVVRYAGHPHRHVDPDQSSEGWIVTHDGATTVNEPVGAMTWFPSNNTPRDKATYRLRITAPSRLAVAGNGVLARRTRHGDRTTWVWRQDAPMATYLSMISVGDYRVFHSRMRTASGRELPLWSFVDRQLSPQQRARRLLPRIIRWAEPRFGPYPFRSSGLVAHKLSVGYALETQDRPVFPGPVGTLEEVHELVHQWYGDSVTLRDWGDIWLNEGFATYAEWLWQGSHGGRTPAEIFQRAYAKHGPTAALWSPAPAALTDPADLFGASSYLRGAMTLQVLRERVGTTDFFRILRSWARVHRHGGASTAQFVALAERISGKDLDRLFQDWLYTAARPRGY